MPFPLPKWVFLFSLAVLAVIPAFAEENQSTQPVTEMETVIVTGGAGDQLSGTSTLNRSMLDHLPARNGSINEAISTLPGVQLGEYSRTSDNGGEVLPPNLSISGGRFYENNFIIDGMGNNSLLDPAFPDTNDLNRVPGHPQESFLHPSLVETISVYRSNISARYGSFTGGTVDVQTRDPSSEFGGQINSRHTRSEWTELHIADAREKEFDHPTNGMVQPEFRKYDSSLSLDLPFSDDSGVLVAASRIYSKIPLVLVDHDKDQYRTLDNYFLKYVNRLSPEHKLTLAGSYTPYTADLFLTETVASDYNVDNDAYGIAAKLQSNLEKIFIEFNIGYRNSVNTREAPSSYFPWQVTPSKSWGDTTDADFAVGRRTSREGGYGDLEQSQGTWSTNFNASLEPVKTASIVNTISFGGSFEQVEGEYARDSDVTYYSGVCGPFTNKAICNPSLAPIVVCPAGSDDCISSEQFMYQKTIYPADSVNETIRFYAAYIEDSLTWDRLTLRPGLRFSSDDLQYNDSWAPRLAASFDVSGDGETILIGGVNRYYGKMLLTHALTEGRTQSQIWKRDNKKLGNGNMPEDWVFSPKTVFPATRVADLDTPYTDEWTVGLAQKAFGGVLNLDYVERNGEDELYSKLLSKDAAGYIYTEWTNDGCSNYQAATLSWQRAWKNHDLLLSATWQETETSNQTYADFINSSDKDKDGMIDPVWHDGHLIDREDLPRPDFNREWAAVLTYMGRLPYGFTFTNVTRYRSGYMALTNSGNDYSVIDADGNPTGEKFDIYEEIKQPESWGFDWRIDWERALREGQALVMTLEINNVFDEKVVSGEAMDVYDLGRQFWLGMTYKF